MDYIGTTGKMYTTVEPALGKGGEGSVYKIQQMPNCVLKVFLPTKRTETRHKKLLAMIATNLPDDAMKQITWPIDVVYENGQFAGYIMPAIKNNEDLNVMYSDKYACTLSEKITIAKNLCAAINSVHCANQVCGDLNPQNISVDPHCAIVTLVDTDSYHITEPDNSRVYRCEVGLPEYLPREIQEKMKNGQTLASAPLPTFTKQTDLFALAVHIFALLMNGCHPFACAIDNRTNISHMSISKVSVTAPQPIDNICSGFFPFYAVRDGITTPKYAPSFDYLPKEIRDLFVRAFVDGHSNPKRRPDAVEWFNALTVMQKNLKTCKHDTRHMYPAHNSSCPWCSVAAVMNAAIRPSGSRQNSIAQTSINTQQHYATPKTTQSSNKGGAGKKIAIFVVLAIVALIVFKSCLGNDNLGGSSNNGGYNGDNYVSDNGNYDDNNNDDYYDDYNNNNSNNATNNNNNNNSNNNTQDTTPQNDTISIPNTEKKSQTVDSIVANSKAIAPANILTYSGNITNENQKDEYSYTVPYDGRTRVEISELKNGTCVALYIYNASGERVGSDSYCYNEEGVTLKGLVAGETYKIQVRQESGYSTYRLTIGQPKPETDISNLTLLTDSIQYTDQRNVYTFTVPRDGRYRLELSGMKNGTCVELYVFDYLDNTVASDSYCYSGEGVTLKSLKAGEVYSINVRQSSGFGDYTMSIGTQKPTIDITSLSEIKDSIEYTDQRNVYSFTVPVDGRYRFELAGMTSGTCTELYVFDSLDNTVGSDSYCYNDEGVTLKGLKAGEVYEVQVRQNSGFSGYTLKIGKQKETTNVSSNVVISDSIEYVDQRNVYNFVADKSGTHTFTISGMQSGCSVELYVFNELGETVASDSHCYNGEGVTLKNIKSGDDYEIQVRYNSGFSNYKLTIE